MPRNPNYSRVSSDGDEEHDDIELASTSSQESSSKRYAPVASNDHAAQTEQIALTILDFAQSKFVIEIDPSATIADLKRIGAEAHKVPVALQRLIFRGRLLEDDQTVKASGLTSGVIVHLFPKPRVVIHSGAAEDTASESSSPDDDTASSPPTGRVPTIVYNADEAERRSQILVLGSVEYIEAQNNVKLFSFMLLIISVIELLNLLAVGMGAPQNSGQRYPSLPTDDIFVDDDMAANSTTPNNAPIDPNQILYQSWGWLNTLDLVLSLAGVYVAMIGIQASNENTLRLARRYLFGTLAVGVLWLVFNYVVTVKVDTAIETDHQQNHPTDDLIPDMTEDDIYQAALSVMVLPGVVWLLCCVRAWQFQHLLHDAEQEASDRIQSELASSSAAADADEELAVQQPAGTMA